MSERPYHFYLIWNTTKNTLVCIESNFNKALDAAADAAKSAVGDVVTVLEPTKSYIAKVGTQEVYLSHKTTEMQVPPELAAKP